MKIVCIGWGSLIYNSKGLKLKGGWHEEGPKLPIEFARQSENGRITLVIHESFSTVQTYWAQMDYNEIAEATEALRGREGRTKPEFIHHLTNGEEPKDDIQKKVFLWLEHKDFDCAIWTGLPPKFAETNNRIPTLEELISYIRECRKTNNNKFELIKNYILDAPEQTKTNYRPKLEAELLKIQKEAQR